jgi:tyrosyl-tRNA synthetase
MLLGLIKPSSIDAKDKRDRTIEMKMSKSNPDSAIFMTDSRKEIKRKINKAYCPEKIVKENPILEYCKYIIFEKFKKFEIERSAKFGGNLEISSYEELRRMYREGKIHPLDLKNAVADVIDKLVKPVREHFKKNKKAKKLFELVKIAKITR